MVDVAGRCSRTQPLLEPVSNLHNTQQDRIVFYPPSVVLGMVPSKTTARLQQKNHFRFHLTPLLLLFYTLSLYNVQSASLPAVDSARAGRSLDT